MDIFLFNTKYLYFSSNSTNSFMLKISYNIKCLYMLYYQILLVRLKVNIYFYIYKNISAKIFIAK